MLALAGGALLLSIATGLLFSTLLPAEHDAFGTAAQLGILLLLLLGWVAQRLIARRGLPPAAYVRLVNSGALHAR
jgi:hypothetical protein